MSIKNPGAHLVRTAPSSVDYMLSLDGAVMVDWYSQRYDNVEFAFVFGPHYFFEVVGFDNQISLKQSKEI